MSRFPVVLSRRWLLRSQLVAVPQRPGRRARPRVETLEGRALMASSVLDPSFGTGGLVLGTLDTGSGPDLSNVAATTVQADGKILIVGTYRTPGSSVGYPVYNLAVRRYNADGSVDTAFGTNGQANIPLPASTPTLGRNPANLVVQTNGAIDLAASTITTDASTGAETYHGLVVQLTAGGQLDSTFATGGEYQLPTANDSVNSVALQGNGQLLAYGTNGNETTVDNATTVQAVVIRFTAAGAPDTTFAGGGEDRIDVPVGFAVGLEDLAPIGIAIAPSGQIYLAASEIDNLVSLVEGHGDIIRLNGDGTLDTAFGYRGIQTVTGSGNTRIAAIGMQSNGQLIVGGSDGTPRFSSHPFLVRLQPLGAVDSSFRGIFLQDPYPNLLHNDSIRSIVVDSADAVTVGGTSSSTQVPSHLFVERFTSGGQVVGPFGLHGRIDVAVPASSGLTSQYQFGGFVALTSANKILLAGTNSGQATANTAGIQSVLAQVLPIQLLNNATDDFDGDGKSDIAAELTTNALYAYRKSNGTGDVVQQFGQAGVGASIPVSGDFDGDGRADVAVYLPALGDYAFRSTLGGGTALTQFGPSGTGASIPAPGDYFGDGETAMAVYIPAQGAFAIRGPNGYGNVLVPFGVPGAGQSIPAPGDYDGDGVTDLAVYIPSQGVLAYRPSSGGKDVTVPFGPAGAGASIPAPGDYDGDGKTDVAVYIPAMGAFAIHPSSNSANYLIPFGMPGSYNSIPAPGDYDGDGRTDAAVYLPTLGEFAYRPSGGGSDVLQGFGQSGYGRTVPTASIPYALPPVSAGATASNSAQAAVFIPLTEDLTSPTTTKKKAAGVV